MELCAQAPEVFGRFEFTQLGRELGLHQPLSFKRDDLDPYAIGLFRFTINKCSANDPACPVRQHMQHLFRRHDISPSDVSAALQ
jgi:hypothetical protein